MNDFLNVLVWFAAVASTGLFGLRVFGFVCYECDSKYRALHEAMGVRMRFPMFWPFVIALHAWAWIIIQPLAGSV